MTALADRSVTDTVGLGFTPPGGSAFALARLFDALRQARSETAAYHLVQEFLQSELGADGTCVLRLAGGGQYTAVCSQNLAAPCLRAIERGFPWAPSQSFAAPLLIVSAPDGEPLAGTGNISGLDSLGALLLVPILGRASTGLSGAVLLCWRESPELDEVTIATCQAVTSHLGVVLEQLRSAGSGAGSSADPSRQDGTRRARRNEVLVALAGAVTLDEVLAALLGLGAEAASSSAAAVVLANERDCSLEVVHAADPSGSATPTLQRTRADGEPLSSCRAPAFLGEVEAALAPWPAISEAAGLPKGRPLACLPLSGRGVWLGALLLEVEGDPAWSSHERYFLLKMASYAALAIERARLQERTQRGARAREDLLAVVAHDLRHPLSVIAMKATLMLRSLPPDAMGERWQRDLESILRSTGRMARLLRDMLGFARIEAGSLRIAPEPQRVREIVRQAGESARALAVNRRIELDLPPEDDVPTVWCDRERVLQVLDNLVGNAIKFTPEGALIRIALEVWDTDVVMSVEDSGCGISPEELPHIFDRFWQASGETRHGGSQGAGLGLFIAKALVEAHNGRIWAESTEGVGSRFYFSLPTARASQEIVIPSQRTVLVVDADPLFRREVSAILQQHGCTVACAAHGREALDYLRAHVAPSLLLVDPATPGMDGSEPWAEMRRDPVLGAVPLVLVTEMDEDGAALSSLEPVEHIRKPVSLRELIDVTTRHCGERDREASGSRRIPS